jgi:hypothetical protein
MNKERRMKIKRAGLVLLPLTLFAMSEAQAELVTVDVAAKVNTVTDPGYVLGGAVAPGNMLTGTYTYETPRVGDLRPSANFADFDGHHVRNMGLQEYSPRSGPPDRGT